MFRSPIQMLMHLTPESDVQVETDSEGELEMNVLKRFVFEDEGLEMLEWAIVAALFATAGAVMWLTLGSTVTAELTTIDTSLSGSANSF